MVRVVAECSERSRYTGVGLRCRDMFCAGRVVEDDLKRTMQACGGSIVTTVSGLNDDVLGTCELFEEKQLGGERSVNCADICLCIVI